MKAEEQILAAVNIRFCHRPSVQRVLTRDRRGNKPGDDGRMERVEGVTAARPVNLLRLPLQFVMAWAIRRHLRPR